MMTMVAFGPLVSTPALAGPHVLSLVTVAPPEPTLTSGEWELVEVVALKDNFFLLANFTDSSGRIRPFLRVPNEGAISLHDFEWIEVSDSGVTGDIEAFDVNLSGQVVGRWHDGVKWCGFDWDRTRQPPDRWVTYFTTLTGGGEIRGINDQGDKVGFRSEGNQPIGMQSGDTSWTPLPGWSGWTGDGALAVSNRIFNNVTQVWEYPWIVGQAEENGIVKVVVWKGMNYWVIESSHDPENDCEAIVPTDIDSRGNFVGTHLGDLQDDNDDEVFFWVRDPNQTGVWTRTRYRAYEETVLPSTRSNDIAEPNDGEFFGAEITTDCEWPYVWDGTTQGVTSDDDFFILPMEYQSNRPYGDLPGEFIGAWPVVQAVNNNACFAGYIGAYGTSPSVCDIFISASHDINLDGGADIREKINNGEFEQASWAEDWILDHAYKFRTGTYGVADAGKDANRSDLLKPYLDLVRLHSATDRVVEDFGTLAEGTPASVINLFGQGEVAGDEGCEIMLMLRDRVDPDSQFDRVPATPDLETLEELRCVGYHLAHHVDYIQLGNEAYSAGSPGALDFEPGSIPGYPELSGTWEQVITAGGINVVQPACKAYHRWLDQMATAIREGSIYAGRPIRIVTPAPTLGVLTAAAARTSNDWQASPSAWMVYYTFTEEGGGTWADIQDMHLHWDGSEEVGGRRGHEFVTKTILEEFIFNTTGSSWLANLPWTDAPPIMVGVSEYGAKTHEDWWDEHKLTVLGYYTDDPNLLPFDEFNTVEWIFDDREFGYRPDHEFPDIEGEDMGIENLLRAMVGQGDPRVRCVYGLYGNAVGSDLGDENLFFIMSSILQPGMHPRHFPSGQPKWNIPVYTEFLFWTDPLNGVVPEAISIDHEELLPFDCSANN